MQVLKLKDVLGKADVRKKVVDGIRSGKILVYPTDTIYGIGCNAELGRSVERIAEAKGREEGKTFSMIAPGKEWIWSHATVSKVNKDLIDRLLPGPYTVILSANRKSPKAVVSPEKTIGVRIPRHPFSGVIEEAGVPFVTTSLNMKGEPHITSISGIPDRMKASIDFVIDAGTIEGTASRIFDMRTDNVSVIRR